jgi:hypothetical protein
MEKTILADRHMQASADVTTGRSLHDNWLTAMAFAFFIVWLRHLIRANKKRWTP